MEVRYAEGRQRLKWEEEIIWWIRDSMLVCTIKCWRSLQPNFWCEGGSWPHVINNKPFHWSITWLNVFLKQVRIHILLNCSRDRFMLVTWYISCVIDYVQQLFDLIYSFFFLRVDHFSSDYVFTWSLAGFHEFKSILNFILKNSCWFIIIENIKLFITWVVRVIHWLWTCLNMSKILCLCIMIMTV